MSDLKARFDAYHQENPDVWIMFERFTKELVNAGVSRLSANRVFERMRWESDVTGNDGFKLNNDYRPFYSRMYERHHPQDPQFTKRRSQADT